MSVWEADWKEQKRRRRFPRKYFESADILSSLLQALVVQKLNEPVKGVPIQSNDYERVRHERIR